MGAYVALLTIDLHFPDAGSLKAKRKELQAVKARLRQKLGASVAEVDHHDVWQRSTLGAAVVAGTPVLADQHADAVERYLIGRYPESVRIGRTVVSFADMEG